ncbi:arylsulfatase [Sphingobium sp. CAP-1]|uniref:arylsulfatase n=1 Tax=Sphingobium sp. CAP-1 TaxID=2676077 RepID=UPI001E3440B2|nr:arylsulfatase [Sphingobium sp. CAP-1]
MMLLLSGVSVPSLAQGTAANMPAPQDAAAVDRRVLPVQPAPFQGQIGTTYKTSRPDYAPPVQAPAGAPNVLLIMTDDVGFGAASTFGGPVPTPNLDRLASRGLRYNRFHTTAMCSPTRASLLTGRNPHNVGTGYLADGSAGYPGYNGEIPRSAASIAKVLKLNGYSTAMIGKHHNIPGGQKSAAGPFDLWPTGLGFEHFYGFIGGDTDQWHPLLYRNTERVHDEPQHGETLDHLFVDDALSWLHTQKAAAPDKPFFLYLAPGTAHAPHQAPPEWIAKFKGKFDSGWDQLRSETLKRQIAQGVAPRGTKLTPRPDAIPAWSSLSPAEQAADARMMEVFAGMLAYQDAQIGRLLDELDRMGQTENTFIIFIEGDNGGSAEGNVSGSMNELGTLANGVVETTESKTALMDRMGGPGTYQLYPVGWSWATNSPFQWTKQVASHLGGTRNGMVVSWPARIQDQGKIRSNFTHVIDVAPTILEAIGLPVPVTVEGVQQQPIDGQSMMYSFAPNAPEKPRTQYFELAGSRAIYKDGWLANTTPGRLPWHASGGQTPLEEYKWELYDLRKDFSQSTDLAAKEPERLAEMKALWTEEAKRSQVFPLDDRLGGRSLGSRDPEQRKQFVYWGAGITVTPSDGPPFGFGSFSLTADIIVPDGGASGVLLADGSRLAGWSFFLDNGRPVMVHATSIQPGGQHRVAAAETIPAGPAQIRYDYKGRGMMRGGTVRISVNGRTVAEGDIPKSAFVLANGDLETGQDTGEPVTDYSNTTQFSGIINKISVDLN